MSEFAPLADALAQKGARLERCVLRAREEYAKSTDFLSDFSRQDATILNIQRACELAIDMGNMVIAHEAAVIQRDLDGLQHFAGQLLSSALNVNP